MLKRRRYVDDGDLCPPYQFPEKVLPYVNVLRVGVGDRLLRELHCTLITLEPVSYTHLTLPTIYSV